MNSKTLYYAHMINELYFDKNNKQTVKNWKLQGPVFPYRNENIKKKSYRRSCALNSIETFHTIFKNINNFLELVESY